jgi:hypothetical protein
MLTTIIISALTLLASAAPVQNLPPLTGFVDGDKSMTITDYKCKIAAHCTSVDCLKVLADGDERKRWYLEKINLVESLGMPKMGTDVCIDIEIISSFTSE